MNWVLTAMSKDRPGIVEDIATIITKHDGNWVKSAMSRLGGEFAGIVQYQISEQASQALANELQALSAKGIQIVVQKDPGESNEEEQTQSKMATIELTGIDHKGIMNDITHLLARKNVTIETLETGIFPSSMAGQPMFYAKAKILLPHDLSVTQLREATESIASDIMVDINLDIDEEDR